MMKRIISLTLAALTLFGMVACSAGETGPAETSAVTSGETSAAAATTADPLSDGLPEADLKGWEMKFALTDANKGDIWLENQTGEVTDDAVYDRQRMLEERFNIKLATSVLSANVNDWYAALVKLVLAGDDVIDLAGHYAYQSHNAISQKIYSNWRDIKYIDLEKPWYNQAINDSATINGKLFGLTGFIDMSTLSYNAAMFFNMKLAASYGVNDKDLYKKVYDGKWTFDEFSKTVSDMYADLNGDGNRDGLDRYGYASYGYASDDVWEYAFQLPITRRDAKGKLVIDFMNDKRANALEMLVNFYNTNKGALIYAKKDLTTTWLWYDQYVFTQGILVFVPSVFLAAYDLYRDMEDPYGILPFPKYQEAQDGYYTYLNDRYSLWGIPVTAKETDNIGMIVEAMACEGYKSLYPAYYTIALKTKFAENSDIANMVDIITSGAQFDVACMFGETSAPLGGLAHLFRTQLRARNTDLASAYAAVEAKAKAGIEQIYSYYE